MSYFAPYIDSTDIHMPTYEDRLAELVDSYRTIFGIESELSASVPDYQLLSVFAKALDDVSALTLQAYNSRNPMYAAGTALDLLLPQYGLVRGSGESDASVRKRMRLAAAARGTGLCDSLLAAIRAHPTVDFAKVYENDTGATDGQFLAFLTAKLAQWQWDGTNTGVDAALAAIPQATKQTDNLDGTVTVTLTGSLPAGRKAVLPVPMGVTANQ